MKRFLLIPLMLCSMLTVNAQDFKKFTKVNNKVEFEEIQKAQPSLSLTGTTQMPTTQKSTRGSIEDYIMNPLFLTNNDFSLPIYYGELEIPNNFDVATYYAPTLVEKFGGNTLTKVYAFVTPGATSATFWIRKSPNGENLWEKTITNFTTDDLVEVPCDYTIDDEGFFVGYTATGKFSTARVYYTENSFAQYSLILGTNGELYDYSSNGSAYIVCETEGEAGLQKSDVAMSSFNSIERCMVGEDFYLSGAFINLGYYPVLSYTAQIDIEGVMYTAELKADTIPFLGTVSFQIPCPAPTSEGRHDMYFEVTKVNGEADATANDNGAMGQVIALSESFPRKAVMEEFTGTWCGWCPRGIVGIEKLKEDYPNDFIAIGVHADDNIESSTYVSLANYAPGFPSAFMNRITFVDPYHGMGDADYGIKEVVDIINQMPTEAQIGLSSKLTADNKIEVTSYSNFSVPCPTAPYTVAYAILEDNLMGFQTNYYSSQYASSTGMTLDNLSDDLKYLWEKGRNMSVMFNDVAHDIYDIWGIEGSLSGAIEKGVTKQHTYVMDMPANVKNTANVSVVAMLMDYFTGEIIAAEKVKLGEEKLTAIESVAGSALNADVKAVAGAVVVTANNATAEIFTIDGKLIASQNVNGTATISTSGLHGTIIVRVADNMDTYVKKITL